MTAPDHVLVPLDGSPLANEALTHALATFDRRVTVLNVVTPLDAGMIEGGVLEPDDERVAAARERTERLVEQARDRAAAEGRTVDTAIETGDPADAILEYVDDHDVDHVVMGGHGGDAGSIARRLLGTVATAVVGGADVTVTVVRHDD
ncbi:nucleotide-binding universal stress UspA family protein [Halorubrum alkaliphilum]|uniref:Nucleotide-binding universal stress UspA family protein n=1 Tax=Halorubrum alkaliphilum TaxID=261290 RepID=A0A8T4GJK8_9EURY|nr:universal stress protein [Halorubrum alkaliphilum]MBP1923195.1 nucleotide-binding universal stress UspA family protein [Halorubrum alkaliphilum]